MIKKIIKAIDLMLFASIIVIGLVGTYMVVEHIALHKRYGIITGHIDLIRKEKGCYVIHGRFMESYYCSEEAWQGRIQSQGEKFPVFEEGKYYVYSWDKYIEVTKDEYFKLYYFFSRSYLFAIPFFICIGLGYLLERIFLKEGGYFWRPERWRKNENGVVEFKPTTKDLSEKRLLFVLFILLFIIVVLPSVYRAIWPPVIK